MPKEGSCLWIFKDSSQEVAESALGLLAPYLYLMVVKLCGPAAALGGGGAVRQRQTRLAQRRAEAPASQQTLWYQVVTSYTKLLQATQPIC